MNFPQLSFQEMLNVLNVVAVFTATGFAALSAKYAKDSVLEQKQHDNPHVVVFIKQREDSLNIIDLVVKNEGVRSSYDVTFNIEGDDLNVLTDRKLSEISMIKNGIALLSGGEEIRHPMGIMLGEHFNEYKNSDTTIKISYSDKNRNSFLGSFKLGFRGLVDRKVGGKSELSKATEALQEIHVELNKIRQDVHLVANNGIVPITPEPYYSDDHLSIHELKSERNG